MKSTIYWIFLDHGEIYKLKKGEKVIGTLLAPPEPSLDDDTYSVALVIENIEEIPK